MLDLTKQLTTAKMQLTTLLSLDENENENNNSGTSTPIQDKNPNTPKTETINELIVAEYTSLSTELNSRQGIRYQMVQFALAALGALLTVSSVGIQNHLNLLIFAYPILVLILSMIYITNAIESRRIKHYIKTRIETVLPEMNGKKLGWQTYRKGNTIAQGMSLGNLSAQFVFIGTSWFSIIIGQQIMQQNNFNNMLLSSAIWVSIILTVLLLTDGPLYALVQNLHKFKH